MRLEPRLPSVGALCAFLFASVFLGNLALAQGTGTRPNLLLIIPDDLGVDSIGCYGLGTAPPTPVMDSIAQGGLRFTRVFVNPACTPTRAAILTGRHAMRSECTMALPPGAPGLSGNAMTLAVPLADAGYQTAMIGKWHLGNRYGNVTPGAFGWNHFEGVLDSGVGNPYLWTKVTNGLPTTCTQYILSNQVDSAISWIQSQSGPWALALTLTLPHVPYHTPPSNLHTQNLAGLNAATNPRPFFAAMVQAMDTEIGRLLSTLGPAALANTNIVVLADNGTDNAVVAPPLQASHAKGSLYDGGSHVPLIVKGPAVANPGTLATEMVSGIDVFPTILAMCGINHPSPTLAATAPPLDGVSFAAALSGQSGYGRSHIYSEISATPLGDGYSVRTTTHRLIRYMLNQPQHQELYDLAADPLEQNNLLVAPLSPANSAAFQQLTALMDSIRTDGWAELFGDGCAGTAGVPFLRTQTQPRIGTTFVAHMSNLSPQCTGMLGVLGASRTSAGGAPLPFDLGLFGMPGCRLNVSTDILSPFQLPTGFGIYLAIPPLASFYQAEFYLQGVAFEASANATGLIWSRALRCVIGQ